MINSKKIIFAGKFSPPVNTENAERPFSGGREYRSEMYTTYRDMCRKKNLTPMSREDFVKYGLGRETPPQARKRHISEYWGWLV